MKKNVESIFPYGAEIYNEGQINGKGFAVVAEEIQKRAEQTKKR